MSRFWDMGFNQPKICGVVASLVVIPEGDLLLSPNIVSPGWKGTPLVPQRSRWAEGLPLCRMAGAKPEGQATDSVAFASSFFFFSHFPPKNRMSTPKTT
jgi:hypothetical protein